MFISSMAASVCLRKSFSLISLSPRASRWALIAIRRYLATVTPGIATGYWKAMNSPARERSSGSASVISLPSNSISPPVTSSAGWPMIAFASVDLPEPFGPISAWTSPLDTSRSRPLRISLSSALTCRLRISRSAIGLRCRGLKGWSGDRDRLDRRRAGELDQVGKRRARQRLRDPAVHAGPQQLRRAGAGVDLVRAEDPPLAVGVEALHRRDRALQ